MTTFAACLDKAVARWSTLCRIRVLIGDVRREATVLSASFGCGLASHVKAIGLA